MTMRWPLVLAGSLVLQASLGCSDAPNAPVSHAVSGTVTFDKVPSVVKGKNSAVMSGLDFASTVQRPLRKVDLKIVDSTNLDTVLGTGSTGLDGSYTIILPPAVSAAAVRLIAFARTSGPKTQVQDNTAGKSVYAWASPAITLAGAVTTLNANIPSGWNGSAYGNRFAAPFAVLDATTQAALAFLAVRPAAAFPDLAVNWSPNNIPAVKLASETQEEAYAAGRINTSHWNKLELYILGKEDVDTDEYDDHVIVHEWGHYFESKLGRSDSPGGRHSAGDLKDARLAFGEGWGNALSGMVWAPNTVYADSTGAGQAKGFGYDLEDNAGRDPNPGWYSEASIQAILFDLFDDSGTTEPFDKVALGLGPIFDAMTVAQKATPAFTTLFSLVAALKAALPAQAAAIDTLTAYRGVLEVPVADEEGTGETNSGGDPANLPLYASIAIGGSREVTLLGSAGTLPNDLGQNRYLRFTGDGSSHVVTTSTPGGEDVDLYVSQRGQTVAFKATNSGNETTVSFATNSGERYIILVRGFGTSASYTSTVSVQ